MTHTIRLSILAASMALLSACAPLQQAPLLYSSKMTVGLDLSMATSETPGGSIAIGFKNVDAAYVPVAVSKDSTNKNGSIEHSYEIMRVEAIYGEAGISTKNNQRPEDQKENLKKYVASKQAEITQESKLSSLNKELATLASDKEKMMAAQKAAYAAELAAAAVASAAQPQEPAKVIKLNYDEQIKELAEKISKKQSEINKETTVYEQIKSDSEFLFKNASDAINPQRTDKRDAMSVYGRFNASGEGTITGSNAKSNLTAGKIFSTGVASQNLTEAAKIEATQYGATECINKVSEIIGPAPIAAATSASAPAAASTPSLAKEAASAAKIEEWRANAIALLTSLCKPTENQQSGKK